MIAIALRKRCNGFIMNSISGTGLGRAFFSRNTGATEELTTDTRAALVFMRTARGLRDRVRR